MEMRGRRVVVTAGAAGIGRAIAEELAAAGARVHVTDISEAAVADAVAGVPGLSGTTGDASLVRDVDRVLDEVIERLGGLDVLVNNVGVVTGTHFRTSRTWPPRPGLARHAGLRHNMARPPMRRL